MKKQCKTDEIKKKLSEAGIDSEKILAFIFAIIAMTAIVFELIFNGIDGATVSGAVKDTAGTVIDVAVLFIALKTLLPQKKSDDDFISSFNHGIGTIISKYDPIFCFYGNDDADNSFQRYDIAERLDGIATNDPGKYHKFFIVKDKISSIEFSLSKTVFGTEKDTIAVQIGSKLKENHRDIIDNYKLVTTGVGGLKIEFKNALISADDAEKLISIIDELLFMCVAKYKGK